MGQNESKAPTKFKIEQNKSTRNTVAATIPSSLQKENPFISSLEQETPNHGINPNQLSTEEFFGKKQGKNYQEQSVLFTSNHLEEDIDNTNPVNSLSTPAKQCNERPMSLPANHSREQKNDYETGSYCDYKNLKEKYDDKTTQFSDLNEDIISDEQLIGSPTKHQEHGLGENDLFSAYKPPKLREDQQGVVFFTKCIPDKDTVSTSCSLSQNEDKLSNTQGLKSNNLLDLPSNNYLEKKVETKSSVLFPSPQLQGQENENKPTLTLKSQSHNEENDSISRLSRIERADLKNPFVCSVEPIKINPVNIVPLLSGQPLIKYPSTAPQKTKEPIEFSMCNDTCNFNIGASATNVLGNKPMKKLISSGNPFLQSNTKGRTAKDIVGVDVSKKSPVIPVSTSENDDNKASDDQIKYINTSNSQYNDKVNDLDDSVSENLEIFYSDIHGKNQKSPLKDKLLNSKNDEFTKRTLQHVQKIAENLTCSTDKNPHKGGNIKTEFTDTTNKGRFNQRMLHNCIVKMRNVSCYDNKEFMLSLQKEIIGHLTDFNLFTSALKTCPVLNYNILSVCEAIEANLKELRTNFEEKNTCIITDLSVESKVVLEINEECQASKCFQEEGISQQKRYLDADNISSSIAPNLTNDIHTSKNSLDKKSNIEGKENKAISPPLNPFMTLLNELPESLDEEKQYICLDDSKLCCRICEKSFPFTYFNLMEHLRGKTHRSMIDPVSGIESGNKSFEMSSTFPNKQSSSASVEDLSNSLVVEPSVKNNLPNYKGVLDLITHSIKEGLNFSVNVYICLICDFLGNDKNKALTHVENNHKAEQTATWHHCGTCLIHIYGTNIHFMEHCSTEQHITIVKIKSKCNVEDVGIKYVHDQSVMEDDRASVGSSKSEKSNRSSSRMTPHEILLSIAKDKIEKNIRGPFGLYCQVCNFYATVPGHLDSSKHAKNLSKLKFQGKSLHLKECSTCQICLFGDFNVWQDHQSFQTHKELLDASNVINKETLNKICDLPKSNRLDNDDSKTYDVHRSSSSPFTLQDKETNISEQNLSFDESGPHYQFMKIVLKKHLLEKKPTNVLYGLYCHLCQLYFHDQDQWELHLGGCTHNTRMNSPEWVGRELLHNCASCNILLIGNENVYYSHLQSLSHKAISAMPDQRQQKEESESKEKCSEDEDEYSSSENEEEGGEDSLDKTQSNSDKKKGLQGKRNRICNPNGVYFKGLPQNVKHKDIAKFFKQYGTLESCILFKNNSSGLCIFKKKIDATTVLMKKTVEINRTNVVVRPLMVDEKVVRRKGGEKNQPKLDPDVVSVLSSKQSLDSTVSKILAEMNRNFHLNQTKGIEISKDLTVTMPGCRVVFFGSQVTGLATAESDFDIYIDYDGKSFYSDLTYDKQQNIIRHLEYQLSQRGSRFVVKETILEARVPIIRVVHMRTNTPCDISCRSGLSVENSHLIRVYLELDPRIRWLVVAIKVWMFHNGLLNSAAFTSYATVWLVLFFLMRSSNPVVCPVITLQQNCKTYTVARWDCRFHRDMREISRYFRSHNQQSELQLLSAFFQMYASFPFHNSVLCPLNGNILAREQFENVQTLPREFYPYIEKVVNSKTAEKLKIQTPICLQDPFDLSHNITKGVSFVDLDKFKKLCFDSHKMCQIMLK